MEISGAGYLFNLSVVAMTFAAVSALVMLIRQSMGGRVTDFDVYLIVAFVSMGCVLAFDAMLPSLVAAFEATPEASWAIASILAAIALAGWVVVVFRVRRRASPAPIPGWVMFIFAGHGFDALLLAANGVVPSFRNAKLFLLALTLSLAVFFFSIVRRIGSLLGEKRGEDWSS